MKIGQAEIPFSHVDIDEQKKNRALPWHFGDDRSYLPCNSYFVLMWQEKKEKSFREEKHESKTKKRQSSESVSQLLCLLLNKLH